MSEAASYRRIIQSTSIIGAATVGSIAIGMVRMKAFALVLGPVGIGVIGLLNTVLGSGATLAGMGVAASAVRAMASNADAPETAAGIRVEFWVLSGLLALAGAILMVLLRQPIAELTAAGPHGARSIGWLAIGVGATVLSAAIGADIQSFRRIGDLARVQLLSALVSAVAGLAMVFTWADEAIVAAVIAAPVATLTVGAVYHARLPRLAWTRLRWPSVAKSWRALIGLGAALVLSGLASMASQIAVRGSIAHDIGLREAGYFQAAWGISVTNLGLVLTAMAADYFPRLSAVSGDSAASSVLVNQQLQVALLIGGPLLAAMIAGAPLVLHILYSAAFLPASEMLRWQLAGDVLKLASWPLGYVLIARGDKRVYLAIEAGFAALYFGAFVALRPVLGLEAAGVGYFAMYAGYLVVVAAVCRYRHGVGVTRANTLLAGSLAVVLLVLIGVGRLSPVLCEAAGAAIALVLVALGYKRMRLIFPAASPISVLQRFRARGG